MAYQPIPISVASDIVEGFGKDQVMIIAWDNETGSISLVSHGSTEENRASAAQGVDAISDYLVSIGMIEPNSPGEVHEDPNNRLTEYIPIEQEEKPILRSVKRFVNRLMRVCNQEKRAIATDLEQHRIAEEDYSVLSACIDNDQENLLLRLRIFQSRV